ncbi:alanine racemase [Amphritea sp.]|uniref:alanine racemase n=1 Tax=Amphritea sp. TaxID=1872502 RepID=UPI003D0B6BCB
MSRAAKITVDLDAIRHNYRLARSLNSAGHAVAIIKANAYGHGAVEVAKALEAEADAFGVACIEEAVELIDAGIEKPVLLLEGYFETSELDYISEQGMWCAVHSLAQIEQIAAASLSKPITVWLKMNSGMNRLGVHPDDYQAAFKRLKQLENVADIVLMTHFSSSDELDKTTTDEQLAVFNRASEGLDAPHCLANSAAVLAWSDARRDWMRPGLMLYGATPFPDAQDNADKLIPAMTLTSEIIAVRDVKVGESVGYAGLFCADQPTRVGTVAMGYADGYSRHAVTGTPVWINGHRSRIIGRVSMDMLGVDLTGIPDADIGTEVEFWGRNVTAAEVATFCDTIPYTLFTGITRRVHKCYINK